MKKSQIFSICTIALGALGLIFALFLAGITMKASAYGYSETESYSGLKTIFGEKDGFDFSIFLFIAFLAAIAGLVFAILPMAGIKKKAFPIVSIACFVAAGIFFFMTKQFVNVDGKYFYDWSQIEGEIFGASMKVNLGVGAILGGIFFIGAGVTSALPLCIKD
ncbi:MAG: hypothetical protein J6Y28_02515 [Acholeplasmatales bacterium]|nr:hypothetical protein [Acholeplasmatales bacterium]